MRDNHIGLGDTFVLMAGMSKEGVEHTGEEDSFSYSIEDVDIATATDVSYTDKGIILYVKGQAEGETNITFTHVPTGQQITVKVKVVSDKRTFDLSALLKMNNFVIYNAGLYVTDVKAEKLGAEYHVSFNVYNTTDMIGAVDFYNTDGERIGGKQVGKFKSSRTDLWDLTKYTAQMTSGLITGDDWKIVAKQTSVDEVLPQDARIVISNNYNTSDSVYLYNNIDLFIFGLKESKGLVSGDPDEVSEKSLEKVSQKDVFDKLIKQMSDTTKDTLRSNYIKSINGWDAKAVADLMEALLTSFTNSGLSLDDIIDITTGSGVSIAQDFFEEYASWAGKTLKYMFKVNEYLNLYMQLVYLRSKSDSPDVIINIDSIEKSGMDYLVDNDVIVQKKDGSFGQEMLKVLNITDSSSHEIL